MDAVLLIGASDAGLKRLRAHLVRCGFKVTCSSVGELQSMEEGKDRFALGILDTTDQPRVALLMEQLRSKGVGRDLPLILLLKEQHLREFQGLRGVEDFLVEPVDPALLEARLRFVLQRLNHLPPGAGVQVGTLAIDPDRYEVTLGGEPLELTYKEFELMKFLATHPGRVYNREQLLNQVWGYDFIGGTRTVDVHIRRLRAKLGPKYASLIATVRNVGYKFLESL